MARVSRKKQNLPTPAVDTPIRRWKTALYVRLSVEDNGKGSDSIENQTTLLEDYIASRSYLEKTALFVDNGYTGTDFLRPEFNRMMEAVKMGIVDCIVVKDLSRLGRNYIETSQFIEKVCPFFDLRFISVNDSFDTATVTSEGHLSASLSNIVNDFYAKDISHKVTTALQAKMERGDYIGNYAPYGYRKDPENKNHLLIDPETAPIVVQIFQWRAEGVSYMGINKKLNDAGILSPSQLKRERGVETNFNKKDRVILWNKHMITEILQNIVYIGHLAQKKGSQCLYGKKFVCAECGAIMKLQRSISTKKDKVYFTFKCPTYAEHGTRGCSDVKIRKQDLDDAVFSFIKSQMEVFLDMEKTLHSLLAMKKAMIKQDNTVQEIRTLRQKLAQKQSLLSGQRNRLPAK